MNPFEAVGNFLGGLFGQKKKKDEERPRPQVTVRQPSPFTLPNFNRSSNDPSQALNPLVAADKKPPQPLTLQLGGVQTQPQPSLKVEDVHAASTPMTLQMPKLASIPFVTSNQPAPQAPPKDNRPWLEKIGAGFQQATGRLIDTAVQGGSTLSLLGDQLNPFISEEQRQKKTVDDLNASDFLRKKVNSLKDISGNQFVGNRDVDEAAARIANGNVNGQDVAALAGRGLDVGGTATMFINPARVLSGELAFNTAKVPFLAGIKPLLPAIAKESGVYGTLEGSQAVAENYGQNGDINKALQQFAPNFVLGAGSQLGLEGVAYAGGRAIHDVAGRTPFVKSVERAGDNALDETGRLNNSERSVVETPQLPARTPDGSITSVAPTERTPAITSPNREVPTIKLPDNPFSVPQTVSNQPPKLEVKLPEGQPVYNVTKPQTPDEAVAAAQKAIDDAATQVPEQPAPVEQLDTMSPKEAETRRLAEAQVPVVPADEATLARQAANDAPTDAIAENIPTLKSYGKVIPMSEANGYKPVQAADGGTLYTKMSTVGSNRKGDRTFETRWYDSRGNKLTKAQADAMVAGELRSKPIEYPSAPIRPAVEPMAAKVEQPTNINRSTSSPVEPVLENTDELGSITRNEAAAGHLNSDAAAQSVADRVGTAIEAEAAKTGTTWEEINKKVQAAWSKGAKNYQEAGLTKEQFDVARKAADELRLLRSRVDPSLLKDGEVGQFYSPRQAPETEFTQELVNELSRDKQFGLRDNELDLSTTPYRQAIRRYANADQALSDTIVHSLENKMVKDAAGNETLVPTGLKVSDEVKTALQEDVKPYVQAQDDAIRAADVGDAKGIDEAVARGDKAIDDALTKVAEKLPKDSVEAREAIGSMISARRAYMQSTARTNMFSNVVNRLFDQSQKAIVNFGDQALPLVNKITNKMTGNSQPGIATDMGSLKLARKYSKGVLLKQQNRNFMTNVRLAGANAQNPVTKALAKADAAYRSAGTYLTSLGDLSTNAVRATNLTILGKGRAEGLKTTAELEAYLVKNLNTPEYMDIYRNMTNNYSGYIGMPQTLTSTGQKGGKISDAMSKIDNFTRNALDKTPLPNRVKQEINDLIMPAITGFAGATSRVAAKQMNALALGLPNIYRGMKLAASDSPNAKAIGQMMISRSIIDGVSAGGVMAGGALLGANGHWTGEYPSDPNERARWEKEGITPNSISMNVDGKTVYIQPGRILGVLALPLVLPTVIADAVTNGTDPGDAISSVISGTIGQFNDNLGADAIISHITDVGNLLNGNASAKAQAGKSLLNMLGYSISNVVPASGLQNNIANAADPYKRDTTGGLVDIVENRNPFTRPGLPVKTDNLGNPVENNVQASLGSQAITVGDGQGSQSSVNSDGTANLDAEINRLAKAKFEVVPARDVKNSNSQNDAKTLMASKLYQGADDATKASYLKDTLLGTKTKDISKNLDSTERSALIEYKLQSDDQRKKWLEDNDNAVNYYTADYNNLKARKLLTETDDNLENKSGAKYQMLRSQVDKQFGADAALKDLYNNIKVEEWRSMIDPESEDYDPDTAGKLYAYDQARTEAGVSGNSSTSKKPKYTEKKGKGGKGGGRGGSGSDKFAFAALPASLIGNTGGDSKGYADGAPLFKPMADLRAPNTPQIPKGRSISVKRGIQI